MDLRRASDAAFSDADCEQSVQVHVKPQRFSASSRSEDGRPKRRSGRVSGCV
jgi:hypothetical protein